MTLRREAEKVHRSSRTGGETVNKRPSLLRSFVAERDDQGFFDGRAFEGRGGVEDAFRESGLRDRRSSLSFEFEEGSQSTIPSRSALFGGAASSAPFLEERRMIATSSENERDDPLLLRRKERSVTWSDSHGDAPRHKDFSRSFADEERSVRSNRDFRDLPFSRQWTETRRDRAVAKGVDDVDITFRIEDILQESRQRAKELGDPLHFSASEEMATPRQIERQASSTVGSSIGFFF